MEENSKVFCEGSHLAFSTSLDEFQKKTVDTIAVKETMNRKDTLYSTEDFPGKRLLSFHDISSGNFGEESIGILPLDISRDSLGFMNISSSDFGRESLRKRNVDTISMNEQINRRSSIFLMGDYSGTGRTPLSFHDKSLGDFGRESMGILPPDFGKESLGFMNISSSEFGREESLWKRTVDTISISEQINQRASICHMGDYSGTGRPSLSFHDKSICDLGRESMGILPPDFGKESLGFMNISSSDFGRESLGLLHINSLRETSFGMHNLADFGRESIGCGRESLGILHLRSPDLKFPDENTKVPDILLSTIEEGSDHLYNTLDTAFLLPYSRKSSAISSTGSSANPCFNDSSLEGPSKIYSLSSLRKLKNNKSDLFDTAYCGTVEISNFSYSNNANVSSICSQLNRGKLFSSSELLNSRSRIQSLPVRLKDKFSPTHEAAFKDPIERKCWNTDKTMRIKGLENRSFHGTLDFEDTDTSTDFPDSVFIEGQYFAEKMADGSILNNSGGEVGILDSTPQPNWPDDLVDTEDIDNDFPKCDTETIFKTVDKMLPPPVRDNINYKLKTLKADSSSSNENNDDKSNLSENNSGLSQGSEKNISKLLQNLSNISHDSNKLSVSRKIKDPREILQNLSEILNCTTRSDQQKSEGQNLLSSLANILNETKSNAKDISLEDSGHSSINEQAESPNKENHECFEVLNLCTKNTSNSGSKEDVTNKNEVLNLLLKAKPIKSIVDQRLSKSFSSSIPNRKSLPTNGIKKKNTSISGLDLNKNKVTTSNNSSANSNTSQISNLSKPSIASKLKPKSLKPSTKKGPLKAVIPIGDMKKKNDTALTPERTEQKIPLPMQSKRTSTPIHEPKLKPMAASTPTFCSTTRSQKNSGVSPVARPKKASVSSNVSKTGSEASTSVPKSTTNYVEPKLFRRNSVSEFKRTSESFSKIQRSNSIENATSVISSLSKVRQNIINSPYYPLKQQNPLKENMDTAENKGNIYGNKTSSIRKSVGLGDNLKQIPKLHSNKERMHNDVSSVLNSNNAVARNKQSTCSRGAANNNSPDSNKRRNSLGNKTGMMSSLVTIRHNMLNSPHFKLKGDHGSNVNNLFQGTTENKMTLGLKRDLQLGKETVTFSKTRKADKENIKT